MGLFSGGDKGDKAAAVLREQNDEEITNLRQAISEAEGKVAKMTISRTPEGMMKMAEEAANQIEETFAVGGMSRAQRFLNITKTIRRQIAIACGGEALWTD
jgi:hypothetical protein